MLNNSAAILGLLLLSLASTHGFSVGPQNSARTNTCLHASRRQLFSAVVVTGAAMLCQEEPAAATYSAYTHREEDWQKRRKDGEVQYSSARDLRKQLAEIAPMNSEGSKIFCPNGPSAAVSPLMENKCGDRQAMASVYGRTEDVLGNSIPGFNGGRYTTQMGADNSKMIAEAGGFPAYQK